MNQSYFFKSLPTPLRTIIRPMLFLSLGLHGLLMLTPMSSESKQKPPKSEPEKVKVTQLTNTPPPSPITKSSPKPIPKPSPIVRQSRPQPRPIRQSSIPPVSRPRAIPRAQPQPTPATKPQPTPDAKPTPEATPNATASPTPTPTPAPQNAFADFPFPPTAQPGSSGILSGDADKAARNTPDGLAQVVSFYTSELPARKFTPNPVTEEANFKVYEVAKEGSSPQYLHLISQQDKTVIVLLSKALSATELQSLTADVQNPWELAFNEAVGQFIGDPDLGAVEEKDIASFPEPNKFSDRSQFTLQVKTSTFKPMSPGEMFTNLQKLLVEKGFQSITEQGQYGGSNCYKIEQGGFTTYIYFVPTSDNRTVFISSKNSPF